MLVPDFWAEARLQHRAGKRQVTVRRFGWSNTSQEEAQALADQRVREALDRILSGQALLRREPKVGYNGAEGVPIREEVLARHGDDVVTRNSYGAHCLNTPRALFADIDFADASSLNRQSLTSAVVSIGLGVLGAALVGRPGLWPLAAVLAYGLLRAFQHRTGAVKGNAEARAMQRIEQQVQRQPELALRVYRTPAGLRVLATQAAYDPRGDEAAALFDALKVDRVYAAMCRNQNCFRARVSAKPWRIGIQRHIKPRSRAWPLPPDALALRQPWVDEYERRAAGHAACRFVHSLGSGRVHPAVAATVELHDRLSGALTDRPIA